MARSENDEEDSSSGTRTVQAYAGNDVLGVRLSRYDIYRLELLTEQLNEGRMAQKPYRPKISKNAATAECIRLGLIAMGVPDEREDALVPVFEKRATARAAAKASDSGMPDYMIRARKEAERKGIEADKYIKESIVIGAAKRK